MADEQPKQPAISFRGDAEAILASSQNADQGIKDLVEAYQSTPWDDSSQALSIVEEYANKLRAKTPGEENLLTRGEVLSIAPVTEEEVNYNPYKWEEENLAAIEKGDNPYLRAYQDTISKALEDTTTGTIQQINTLIDSSEIDDKMARAALGFVPAIPKVLSSIPGVSDIFQGEKGLQRQLRADSNDTFSSALAGGVGSLLSTPVAAFDLLTRIPVYGVEQFRESRNSGASITTALESASIEAANQAFDVVLDKLVFGATLKKGKGLLKPFLQRATTESSQEFAQDKISDIADVVGLNKDQYDEVFSRSALMSAGVGAVLGGASVAVEAAAPGTLGAVDNTPTPTEQAQDAVSEQASTDLQTELGLSFKETEPVEKIAVIGEPVDGGQNVTTIEEASNGAILPVDASGGYTTDIGEAFIENEDGTTSRVIDGAKKQAHSNAMMVSPEVASKIAQLQTKETTDGGPIVIENDDLGRPYINHPYVASDLTLQEEPANAGPTLIPQAETGHTLQYSNRIDELGSVEHRATVSQGKSNGTSTAGAQKVEESTVAEKIRYQNPDALNPQVQKLLGLYEDFAVGLTYTPNTAEVKDQTIDNIMAVYDNNYILFANAITGKDFGDITTDESVVAGIAAHELAKKAEEIRAAEPEKAEQYDILSANLATASVKSGSQTAQALEFRKRIPFTGTTVTAKLRADATQLATAKVAQDAGISVAQVENVVKEDAQLDLLQVGINEREATINEQEVKAEEAFNAPDKQVSDIEKQIIDSDNATSSEIEDAQKQLDEVVNQNVEVEKKATELETQADNIKNNQEEANSKVDELTKKVTELSKPVDIVPTTKVDNLIAKKATTDSPEASAKVETAKKKVDAAKVPSEKALARAEYQKALNEEKLRAKKESADLDAQIRKAKEEHAQEQKRLKAERDAEIKATKEELARAKEEAKANKNQLAVEKRKQASELRAQQKIAKVEKEAALKEARAKKKEENTARKAALKEQLRAAKELREQTKKQRKDLLDQQKAEAKAAKEALNKDREKIQARKDRNKQLKDAVDSYKQQFASKITPDVVKKINSLVDAAKNFTGSTRKKALDELGRTLAKVKGIELVAGADPWSTFWQANVLSSVSTNFANIVGNSFSPIYQTFRDVGRGDFKKAGRFIKGWTSAIFSKRAGELTGTALRGELQSRAVDVETETELKDLATGVKLGKENDPVRVIQSLFGTGRLGKFLSSPAVTLRALGAMDAVFSRASLEGRIAREAPSYESYLKNKADNYGKFVVQAKNEKAQLESIGVKTDKNFVNNRADEIALESLPKETSDRLKKAVRKDVFQADPTGVTAKLTARVLNGVGNAGIPYTKNLNVKNTIASAIGFANKVARNDMGVDQVYPLVVQGLSEGKTLVINGKEVSSTSTEKILGEIVNAVNNKQIISLKGDTIKPLKYAVGMFVKTASNILDLSLEMIPGIGILDKKFGGAFSDPEFTVEDRQQLMGMQAASTVFTGAIFAAAFANMDDEENAPFYIYGGLRDAGLRDAYKVKGIKPFSFRVGTKVVSYKDIPGLNLIFGGIGAVSDAMMVAKRDVHSPITLGSGLQSAGMGALYAATQLSLLKNIGTLADLLAVQDPKANNSAWDVVSNMAAGAVPFAGAGRELERFVYGDLSRPKDVPNRMLQNIPFAKFVSDNEPALNMFGEPVRTSVIPGIGRFLSDYTSSYELDWALSNGYTFSLPKTSGKLSKQDQAKYSDMLNSEDPDNFEPYLTEEDQRAYIQLYGPKLRETLGKYANNYPFGYSPDVQKKLDRELKLYKKQVKNEILR